LRSNNEDIFGANWWHELFIVMLTISSSHWLSAETRATEKANFSEIFNALWVFILGKQ